VGPGKKEKKQSVNARLLKDHIVNFDAILLLNGGCPLAEALYF